MFSLIAGCVFTGVVFVITIIAFLHRRHRNERRIGKQRIWWD